MKNEPTKENGSSKKPETEDRAINMHIKVLIGIGIVWVGLFALMLVEKAGEIRMMLPIVGIAFISYLIYATYSVLKNRKW